AGLTWKYRQVESGEWNLFQGESQGHEALNNLDAPLPWDHLDTGIDKRWLKEDLVNALEAATVPDCSFDRCSHCGICGFDFGHNVVVEAQPIPTFKGHFEPNKERAQRFRVWYGKHGTLALLSHLDLLRLWDRVARRASLPISFTGGFHPGPRISPASALALGATSDGEILDLELTSKMPLESLRAILEKYLPPELPIYEVEEIDLKAKSATQTLRQAEYILTLSTETPISLEQWQTWIDAILGEECIEFEKTTKRGRKRIINLREQLVQLEIQELNPVPTMHFIGTWNNDGTQLRPEHVLYMLELQGATGLGLSHIHRKRLILEDTVVAQTQ
ncbi:MAG: TIGR03936 family radical SAM-associated protein, partial [Cyanobacteria bacterium P01_F01_bin.42]